MASSDINPPGYSKEEEYFYRRNQELIERKRKALDAQRDARADTAGEHWMHCPKCGERMEEIDLAHIKVEQCTGCHGIYFDQGELETLLESNEPTGFLSGLKRLFG